MPQGFCQKSGQGGSRFSFPLQTFVEKGFASDVWYQDIANRYWYHQDFIYDADPSDPPWSIYDVSSTGTPTSTLTLNATGGAFGIQLTANSQVEDCFLTHGDNLQIQGNLPFLFMARVSVLHAMAANQKVIIGLASAADTDPDDITRNAWFLQAGSTDLKLEFDDNTNNVDDQDTGVDVAANAYAWYAIENGADGNLWFRYGVPDSSGGIAAVKSWNFPAKFGAASPAFGANNLQPYIGCYKSTGTTRPQIKIDDYAFFGVRAAS